MFWCVLNEKKHNVIGSIADFPREHVPVVLAPLLYREEQDITEDR